MSDDEFQPAGRRWVRWFALIVAGFTVAVLFVDGLELVSLVRQARTSGRPAADGRIVKSEVVQPPGTLDKYSARIEFAWSVAGADFRGSSVRHVSGHSSKSFAERRAKKYPEGRGVQVYYQPDDPSDAVLETGINGDDLVVGVFLTPYNAITVGLWTIAWPMWRYRTTGGIAVSYRDGVQRLRIGEFRPVHSALMAAGGTGLLLIIGLRTIDEGPISLGVAIGLLLAIAVIGTATWLVSAWFQSRESRELVLDWADDRFTIPAVGVRESPLTLRISAVKAFRVVTDMANGPDKERHLVAAQLTAIDDGPAVEPFGDEMSEWGAWKLVVWLNRKLESQRQRQSTDTLGPRAEEEF